MDRKIIVSMPKRSTMKINYCLNSLLLSEKESLDEINPFRIIRKFYDAGNLPGIKKMFEKICDAAMADKYNWNEGTPGNQLYFYDKLEGLLEACFLIYIKKGFKKRLVNKFKSKNNKKKPEKVPLPCMLSWEEVLNPLVVINEFFEFNSITKWKQSMHLWLEAGLSNFSVVEIVESKEVLPYYQKLGKLLEASYLLAHDGKKGTSQMD